MKKCLILFTFLMGCSTLLTAQKYGHLNFGNLISQMPETEKANSDLEAFQANLVAEGEKMAEAFREEYVSFATAVQNGDVPPKDQQAKQQQLQKKQQEILAYEQKVIADVQAKRDELLGPIIKRAEDAIAGVAKENGFAMIFDTSSFNAVLFAQESVNVMSMVKAKLGLADTAGK